MEQQSGISDSQVVELLPTAVCVCDMTGSIKRYNEQAAQLWGRRPQLGDANERYSGDYKLYHTDGTFIPHDQYPVAACLQDGLPKKDLEFILERPNLSRIFIRVNIVPVFDDNDKQTGAVACFEDLTQQKEAERGLSKKIGEEKLRELAASLEKLVQKKTQDLVRKTEELKKSEERYHKMVEEVEDYAILMLDSNGTIMNWNKGAEKIKGYKEVEIIGKNFQEFYLPEDREKGLPMQLLHRARSTGKALHEGWRKRKNGTVFWGSIVLTAIHNDEGVIIGFTKVTRDLTERKLAEDQMTEYMSQLEFQNKELEQFVYAASHDLKEPLRKLNLYMNFIADQPSNQLDEKSRDYLNRSLKAAERMKALIEDLLVYSRSTVKAEDYEAVDLNAIVEEIVQSHKEEISEEKGRVIAEKLPVVQGVPFQLKQLFFNLINNSFKYKHPDRNVEIHITSELMKGNKIPAPGVEKHKHYYLISVTDNGIGFEPEYADRIFEIFQRLNNSVNTKGSGIGLAICKKIVQNYKGGITATGDPGKGACFSIFLPAD
ncbi:MULTISPECIES: PAS domain S-box protein [Niastella]|uniref:histidine kinase n=1 Tax=Niastella soli TaxID=2821487 RepID=A0ABS3Z2E2_9BACT|nr:PAS domain S-box protein [Niastella soli]MBO9204337.1 PAS domain S-box protein [Niastella soli]